MFFFGWEGGTTLMSVHYSAIVKTVTYELSCYNLARKTGIGILHATACKKNSLAPFIIVAFVFVYN